MIFIISNSNISSYQHPGYPVYQGGYYPQQYQVPHPQQPQLNMYPHSGQYADYSQNQNLHYSYHPNNYSHLETVSSCGSVASDCQSQPQDSGLLQSPRKPKKGFRKVKSANEKSLPIDPNARELILKCDKEVNTKNKLKLLKGKLSLLIYNQCGSRFLQKLLTKANKEIIDFFL